MPPGAAPLHGLPPPEAESTGVCGRWWSVCVCCASGVCVLLRTSSLYHRLVCACVQHVSVVRHAVTLCCRWVCRCLWPLPSGAPHVALVQSRVCCVRSRDYFLSCFFPTSPPAMRGCVCTLCAISHLLQRGGVLINECVHTRFPAVQHTCMVCPVTRVCRVRAACAV